MNFFHVKRRSEQRSTKMNPLLLPSIIHRSISYLGFNDLLRCRSVSKIWKEETTKKLEGKVLVKLRDCYSVEQFNRVLSIHLKNLPINMFTCIELGQHVSLMDRTVQVALTKLAMHIKSLVINTKVGPAEWLFVLEKFSNLRELEFHGLAPFQPIIGTPSLESVEGKLTGSISNIPEALTAPEPTPGTSKSASTSPYSSRPKELVHLTKITFNLRNRRSEDIFVRRFLRDLFSVATNLKELEWIKEDRFANDFQKTMFDCLMMKTKPGGLHKLAVLNCPSLICGGKELRDLTVRNFPLKEIHFQISSDVSAQCLEVFLESHGATLEIVRLDFCPGTPLNVMISSPQTNLVNLRELSLTEYRRSIAFVGRLPSLTCLTLTRTNIKRALLSIGWAFDNKEQTELSKSLQELYVFNDYLSRDQGNCTREIVLKLAHCFPQLRVIRMEGLDDTSLRHLFKSFHSLEQLYAPCGTYSDEAFRSFTSREQSLSVSGRSPNRYALSAFDASHLKNLRTLELESIGLSDKFVSQGIINWSSLRNVTIKYGRISFSVLSRLMMEMELHRLRLEFCTILTDEVIENLEDPVEMSREEDTLDLDARMIRKWRYEAFRLLFTQNP